MADVTLRHLLTAERARAAGAAWYARLIEAAGGMPLPNRKPHRAEDDAVARCRIYNWADAPSPDMQWYTFAHPFAPGDIPADAYPEPRLEGGFLPLAWQVNTVTRRHADGSVNLATFSLLLPALRPAGDPEGLDAVFIEFRPKRGTPPAGGLLDDDQLLADAYTAEMDIGGITWTASVNRGFKAGNRRLLRDGPVQRRYVVWDRFNDGTRDHPDLLCRFYVDLYTTGERREDDGFLCTTACLANPLNHGRGPDGPGPAQYVVDYVDDDTPTLRLKRAGTLVWGYANANLSQRPFNGKTGWYFTSDGEPIHAPYHRGTRRERDGKPHLAHAFDTNYLARSRAWPGQDPEYVDPSLGLDSETTMHQGKVTYAKDINSPGDSATGWIGPVTFESARALTYMGNHLEQRRDRVRCLEWGHFVNTQVWRDDMRIPKIIKSPVPGLDETEDHARRGWSFISWGPDGGPNTQARDGFQIAEGSHNPEPAYWQCVYSGDEWFLDMQRACAVLYVANHQPWRGEPTAGRYQDKLDGSGEWEGIVWDSEVRAVAWALRSISNWRWVEPTDNPEARYADLLYRNNWGWMKDQTLNNPKVAQWSAFNRRPGAEGGAGLIIPFFSEPKGKNHGYSFQEDFMTWVILHNAWREGLRDAERSVPWFFVDHFVKGVVLSAWNIKRGGHPYHVANVYYMDCRPTGTEESYADYTYNGRSLVPDDDPGDVVDGSAIGSSIQYGIIRLNNAKVAHMLGTELGDALLAELGRDLATRIEASRPQWRFDPKGPKGLGFNPRWAQADRLPPVAFPAPDLTEARLRAVPHGLWAVVSRNQVSDVYGPHMTGADSASYWGWGQAPIPPGNTGRNLFSFSTGAWVADRKHFVATGGGHADYYGSEIVAWSARTGRWARTDDAARMAPHLEETGEPYGVKLSNFPPELDSRRAPPSPDDPTRPTAEKRFPYPKPYVNRENIRGRLAPISTHTYGSVCYDRMRDVIWTRGSAEWGPFANHLWTVWAIDATDGRYWWDTSRHFHPVRYWVYPGNAYGVDDFTIYNRYLQEIPGDRPYLFYTGTPGDRDTERLCHFHPPGALEEQGVLEVKHGLGRLYNSCYGAIIPDPEFAGRYAYFSVFYWPDDRWAKDASGAPTHGFYWSWMPQCDHPASRNEGRGEGIDRKLRRLDQSRIGLKPGLKDRQGLGNATYCMWLGKDNPALGHLMLIVQIVDKGLEVWKVDMRASNPQDWAWSDVSAVFNRELDHDGSTQGRMAYGNFWYDRDYDAFFVNINNGRDIQAMRRPGEIS
ncbi:hypothetical protein [Caenispirillum salinarum]|uniref:hypothetical protein n=1 Tax=Caenispirillum salinarum TaxID=859058 RepID=UPI00384F8152